MRTILCIPAILIAVGCGGGDTGPKPQPQPSLALSPPSYTFLPADIGGISEGMNFTLSNTGTVASAGISFGMSGANGADFSILSGSCTTVSNLAPGGSCVITAAFTPIGTRGAKAASLTVVSGDAVVASAALAGTATAPPRFVLPADLYFGNAAQNDPVTLTITVTNDGDRATGNFSAVIDGTNPSQWSITGSGCFGPLAPGAHCDYTVKFAPTIANAVSANFEILPAGASVPAASMLIWGWGT